MSSQTDKGNGFLKHKFGSFQADPPPEVWDAISSQLAGSRRRGMTIIILSAAASLALAVTLGIHYFGRDIPHEIELAEDQESSRRNEESVLDGLQISPEDEVVSVDADGPSLQTLQGSGLEQKVVEAIAEAVPAQDVKADLPFEMSSSTMSEEMKAGAQYTPEFALDHEENEDIVNPGIAEEVTKADEAAADEKTADLILDAGEVGDVEMKSEIVKVKDKDPRWVLGAMLSPLYSFRDAEPEAMAGAAGQESGMVSYATGLQVGYRVSRRLALESGIIYNKMGLSIGAPGIQVFTQDDLEYSWGGPDIGASPVNAITNSMGNIVSYSGEIYVNNYKLNAAADNNRVANVLTEVNNADQDIRQHLDYLELPFNLRYTLLDKSFKIQVVGGVSTNLLVNNYVTMETASGTTEIGHVEVV